ncbi:MAG: thioredoxin family protein [Erysipelotrichaceae bacterium]
MNLFGFGKKTKAAPVSTNAGCSCGGKCSTTSRIMVMGGCCQKATTSYENVVKAAQELQISEEVVNVSDTTVIASYGVLSTPALLIDEEIVSSGKLITIEDAKRLLKDFA